MQGDTIKKKNYTLRDKEFNILYPGIIINNPALLRRIAQMSLNNDVYGIIITEHTEGKYNVICKMKTFMGECEPLLKGRDIKIIRKANIKASKQEDSYLGFEIPLLDIMPVRFRVEDPYNDTKDLIVDNRTNEVDIYESF